MVTKKTLFDKFDLQSSFHQQVELKGLFENLKGYCLEIHKLYCWNGMLLMRISSYILVLLFIRSFLVCIFVYVWKFPIGNLLGRLSASFKGKRLLRDYTRLILPTSVRTITIFFLTLLSKIHFSEKIIVNTHLSNAISGMEPLPSYRVSISDELFK